MNDLQEESRFHFQLDILMKEIDLIDNTIGRLDELLLRNRNWGTTLWAGFVAIILQQEALADCLILTTALLPLLFWIVDIRWKMALLQTSERQKTISRFLNSNKLKDSFQEHSLASLPLLDPTGESLPKTKRSWVEAIRNKDTWLFYPLQILGSFLLFLFVCR